MEPTSSQDNTRPSPGLARFWQVRPDTDDPVAPEPPLAPEPLETPADLLTGSKLGTFRSRPIPPLAPIASAGGPADPFGLNRAAARSGSTGGRPAPAPPARERHGDPDHSVPPDDEPEPPQDVESSEPEGVGGFGLGGRAGRLLFGGRDGDDPATVAEDGDEEPEASPDGQEPAGEATADADADQDAAEVAEPSDENGREDMNGRAGAPGYAQAADAVADGTAEETPGQVPAEPQRPAAGWASVPGTAQPATPISGGPVSGAPVSPAYAPNPYTVADFTPDHPAGTLHPVSGQPGGPEGQSAEPADPAVPAPVSPAQVQIPATRPPAEDTSGYPDLPPATDGGFGFASSGYSLGRPPEAYGVASVTPAAPAPPEFPSNAFGDALGGLTVSIPGLRAREETVVEEQIPSARRSASLEDIEPVRRAGRRAREEEEEPAAEPAAEESRPVIGRTVWDEDAARHFRAAWHEVKAEFVDDPERALTRAHDLLTDAVNELTEVLLAERDELDPLRGTGTPDTESMRMAMRGYREFLDRILSL
ncbi:hypothetical protein GCM10010109_11100 [Actinoplanes campanulatus]|nr:hypothetical protein GCM10010109_11100 [Actinoplanes campanulatus]GID35334.1 hypothetical protein Aca09nite_18400 [Actinoplanes campanulatus]